jgi:hypothetical protein
MRNSLVYKTSPITKSAHRHSARAPRPKFIDISDDDSESTIAEITPPVFVIDNTIRLGSEYQADLTQTRKPTPIRVDEGSHLVWANKWNKFYKARELFYAIFENGTNTYFDGKYFRETKGTIVDYLERHGKSKDSFF